MERITDEILATGEVHHAFLGVQLEDFLDELPDGSRVPVGARITGPAGDVSAAFGAGLQSGDLIVRFDEIDVRTRDDLIIGIRRYRVGQTVEIEVMRDGERISTILELGERPADL